MPVAAVAGSVQTKTPQNTVLVMDVMPEPCLELESRPSPALDCLNGHGNLLLEL